ncbi:hypothetical protein FZC76_19990 [Sutcliffiella horikoshii]|uniref:Uncharacterized protein n=1 Tax=Sutcliffiella horikoshii TaxID=79883 RepID=A0A5D4SL57_9BACI|nr:hypothetical protein [Sutcliffiella horikoshii]TYS63501.1 hypothetical protein FZC76_19990 [Sutcliffiella horikoshii]
MKGLVHLAEVKQREKRGCLESILGGTSTLFTIVAFLAVGVITGISSIEFFLEGSFIYGLRFGVLCLFSAGMIWVSYLDLIGKE